MSDTRRFCIGFLVAMALSLILEAFGMQTAHVDAPLSLTRFVAAFTVGAITVVFPGKRS